tara:strand:+ start:529 stop:726 length:198 start_codon:yes stop_codon:yes gene_type:complete
MGPEVGAGRDCGPLPASVAGTATQLLARRSRPAAAGGDSSGADDDAAAVLRNCCCFLKGKGVCFI